MSLGLQGFSENLSIEGKLIEAGGRPSGFDYMRITLSCAVLWMHTVRMSYGLPADAALWATPLYPFLKIILPMFFALSGFLVSGSLERSKTLFTFLGLRVIRIYPALMVEVILSAFVLGPIYTQYSLSSYFTDKTFFIYLINITGHVHYLLPGVFLDNPQPRIVNLQMWTIPFELMCYIGLSVLFVCGVLKRKWLAPLGAVLLTIGFCVRQRIVVGDDWHTFPFVVPGAMLVVSFLFGVTFYLYRKQIAHSFGLFVCAAVFTFGSFIFTSFGDLITPVGIAYMTVYLGLTSPQRIGLIKGADYSYGIYLYGAPIQQAFAGLGDWAHNWLLNGIVCTAISALFAAFSWHAVEKPALNLRSVLKSTEDRYIRWRAQPRGRGATAEQAE